MLRMHERNLGEKREMPTVYLTGFTQLTRSVTGVGPENLWAMRYK